jgi:ribosomal protein S18 acetylase RimI-like enzyme
MPDGPDDHGAGARVVFGALARCFLVASEAIPGPDIRAGRRGDLVYGATPIDLAGLNRIMHTHIDAVPDDADIDAVLEAVSIAPALTWWLPPGSASVELEGRLAARGFEADVDDDSAPAMWISLDGLPDPDFASGVTIEAARTVAEVRAACELAAAGFGMPADITAGFVDLFVRVAAGPSGMSGLFMARLEGRPVATALAVVAGDAAVIYNVATLPDARGRGIGGAVTLAALRDARSRGATLGVLESSEMGLSVYRRIGFREAGRFRILVRRDPGQSV